MNIKGVCSIDLQDDVVAALITQTNGNYKESLLVSNGSGKGFESRIEDFAENHMLTKDEAKEYVISHELMHAAGYNSEESCEGALSKYFLNRANNSQDKANEKYTHLSNIASARQQAQDYNTQQPKNESCKNSYS